MRVTGADPYQKRGFMSKKMIMDEVLSKAPNRRRLLKSLGIASAAATMAGTANKLSADPLTPTPEDVLQFALNLEYLEAEFYSIATTGKKLEERGFEIWGVGEPGNAPGPTKTRFGAVDFCDREFDTGAIALDIAADEIAHVQVLRKALQDNG